ncbi:polysaccharide deacetylase family protein [Parablautia sp. Marseille-Q6255]|uniref:polysaccharide deacetylase family protein n=1 Tax=Parablautia sp. Marseille-Q6255 TaxID=3039593 RepID=UPI003FA7660A
MKNLRFKQKKRVFRVSAVIGLLIAAFFAGRSAAVLRYGSVPASVGHDLQQELPSDPASGKNTADGILTNSAEGNWGLSFQEEGKPPVANATREELAPYGAWYAQDTQEKVIYLTFDCGYENGNTPAILAALKKHQAPATFFAVGNFIADNPELIRQMLAEGHTVGNHTMHHPDMSRIAEMTAFEKEIRDLEQIFKETTGQEISKYYRPPQGKYSQANLKMAQQLGYQTFFWSLAYVDWYEDKQPTKEEAFDKLLGRIHPGAVVLLHNTSATNGAILDELLTKWEEMGYRFGTLKDLTEAG